MTQKHIVVYHGHCTDGFGAAFGAWLHLHQVKDAETRYVECHYGDVNSIEQFLDKIGDPRGAHVHVLDFSFSREITDWLIETAGTDAGPAYFTWLDHHKSSFEMMKLAYHSEACWVKMGESYHIVLDNNRSGAALAWDHYVIGNHRAIARSPFIDYIDDRDRWVFRLAGSRALHAALSQKKPWSFEQWREFQPESRTDELVALGKVVLDVWERQIRQAVARTTPCVLTSAKCPDPSIKPAEPAHPDIQIVWTCPGLAVNYDDHQSEIGHELAKLSGTYGMVWAHIPNTNNVKVSLRSIGDYDVSAIAKYYGGGGHKTAAGCSMSFEALLSVLRPQTRSNP